MRNIEKQVVRIISRAMTLPEGQITLHSDLSNLETDSLDYIECIITLEETFQIELDEAEVWRIRTVQDVIDAIKRARNGTTCAH